MIDWHWLMILIAIAPMRRPGVRIVGVHFVTRTPESTKAYQAGLCVDCKTEPHSAGRPRCEKCHTKFRRGE